MKEDENWVKSGWLSCTNALNEADDLDDSMPAHILTCISVGELLK